MAAFLSGEMKDTVQMNPAGAYGMSSRQILPFLRSYVSEQFLSDSFLDGSARNYSTAGREAPACGSRSVFSFLQ